jgi:hypothetical protein
MRIRGKFSEVFKAHFDDILLDCVNLPWGISQA